MSSEGSLNPETLCPSEETYSRKDLRKQCIQWAIMMADGMSGGPGPVQLLGPKHVERERERESGVKELLPGEPAITLFQQLAHPS